MDVTHDSDGSRFTLALDGHQSELAYRISGGVMTITHTGVPQAVGGRGLAGELMAAALGYARGAGLKVSPACSYAAHYMDKHPAFADLRA